MKRRHLFQLMSIVAALLAGGLFLFSDLGYGLSPLAKFFIIFFGIIVGLQAVPALLLFSGMIKGIFGRNTKASGRVLH